MKSIECDNYQAGIINCKKLVFCTISVFFVKTEIHLYIALNATIRDR